jgi:peptide/nickel transport system permease protein
MSYYGKHPIVKSFFAFCKDFSGYRIGMIGLAIVLSFVCIAVFAPFLAPRNPWQTGTSAADVMNPPSNEHIFGTDDVGRDLLSQVIYGARASILIGTLAGVVTLVVGGASGLLAGYYGGWAGELVMRLADSFLSIPSLALLIILVALFGASLLNLTIVIVIICWPSTARIIMSQAISIKERPFVEAARAIGGSDAHIIVDHVLPNVMPLAGANAILNVATAIFLEATLSFFGLGDPTQISWGMILHNAFLSSATMLHLWWWILPPGLCIVLIVLGFYFMFLASDEILNPRLRTR